MRKIILFVLILGFLGEVVTLLVMMKQNSQTKVLGETTISTPTPTPSPTNSPSPSPSPTPIITPIPTPTIIPQPEFTSQQINEFIDGFAVQYGVSPDILRHLAICESGFNPKAVNLSYAGLFQFGPNTWKRIRNEMGEDADTNLRLNAQKAVQTAAFVLHVNKAYIWPNCVPH